MSYVDSQLLPGESVQYRAHLHWTTFAGPYALAALAVIVGIAGFANSTLWFVAGAIAVLAAIFYGWCRIRYNASEFAVTNKRVIIKVGWITRRTVETMLSKIEGVGVDQSVGGRMLNFGSIVVTGTGGTKEPFARIANPLEFRRQVQAAIATSDGARAPGASPVEGDGPVRSATDRVERDCPYCAERILVRAKVCKHCGRDVPATP